MEECKCCYENFSLVKNPLVKCQFCEFETCQPCQKTYLLGTANQPHCMSCKKEWNDRHLFKNFSRTFFDKDVKQHRETLLVENEKALLPDTQPYVKSYKIGRMCVDKYDEIVENNKKIRKEYYDQWPIGEMYKYALIVIRELRLGGEHWLYEYVLSGGASKLGSSSAATAGTNDVMEWVKNIMNNPSYKEKIPTEEVCPELFIALREKDPQWTDLVRVYRKKRNDQMRLQSSIWDRQFSEIHRWKNMVVNRPEEFLKMMTPDDKNKKNKWKWACPGEECKGFLDETNTCGICLNKFCQDCNCVENEDHECDEDIKKNVQMLKKDSKPCPKCSSVIHKIDGCDQMWCPECKTAFSWIKGTIETKIHNPHYYEYLRDTQGHVPREQGDQPCGANVFEQIRWQMTHGIMDNVRRDPVFWNVWRAIHHISREAEHGIYRLPTIDHDKRRLWRVLYLVDKIDETTWKRNLHRQEKSFKKKTEIYQILKTFYELAYEIVMDKSEPELQEFLHKKADKYDDLAKYFNGVLADFSRMYKCVVPILYGKIVGQINFPYGNLKTKKYTPVNITRKL